MKKALKDLNIDEKLFRPITLHAAISTAKNNLILSNNYPKTGYRDEITGKVYQRYQQLLLECNALDFDDLLLYTWRLMDEDPALREEYSRRFEYVLVDEFQDTNQVQYELLRYFASAHQNIFVVGDEDQSIYRWRGADYRNVLRFEESYPNSQKIILDHNYRSVQNVLDAATAVIDHNINRTPKRLKTSRGQGEKLSLFEAADDHAEAAYVVDTIQQLCLGGRASLGDFAVMYRTNAQSRLIEESFLRAGIPYRLVGAQRFYGRREIKDVIAYLRLAQNPADELSLSRIINVPTRGIGDKTLIALQRVAQDAGVSPGEVLLDLGRKGKSSNYWILLARGANLLADFGSMLAGWHDHLENMPLPELYNRILEDTAYHDYLDDGTEEGVSRWENVQELNSLAYEFEDLGLSSFLENLALVSDQDTVPNEADAPTLLTLHAAKGLEFPVVFIVGLDDGLIPHNRSLNEPEEMEEERRLFYVGLTRAKNRVYLVRAEQRSLYGNLQDSIPSRFIEDIPDELLKQEGLRRRGAGRFARSSQSDRWEDVETRTLRTYSSPPPNIPSASLVEQRFKAGMRVRHQLWEEGLVIDSRLQDGDEIVTVAFDSVGFKRLMASLANLEIIPAKK